MTLSEADVVRQTRDYLLARGWRGLRMMRAVVPGAFQAGEPGMADYLFLYYLRAGVALLMWIEFKRPKSRMQCTCLRNRGTRRRCTMCDQRNWAFAEGVRGGVVWRVDDFRVFMADYARTFGWLHSGNRAQGQMDLLADVPVMAL